MNRYESMLANLAKTPETPKIPRAPRASEQPKRLTKQEFSRNFLRWAKTKRLKQESNY